MSERRGADKPAPYRKVHPFWFGLLCVLLAAALGVGLLRLLRTPPRVTDGSGDYTPNISPVAELVRKENERIRDQGIPYVSIAVMLPLNPAASPTSTQSTESIRHALEGAYMAQYWSNHSEGDASAPNVQLLIADSSGDADAWQAVVRELKEKAAGEDRLVAVTGLGSSVAGTEKAIDELVAAKIALVGAVITSDRLEGKATMVRVSPSNSAQARAIAHFLSRRDAVTAVLVRDEDESDSYTSTLAASFTSAFAGVVGPARKDNRLLETPLTYSSALDSADTVLGQMPQRICDGDANVIFYAGRWQNLPPFLRALTRRTCIDRKITVVTGDDASNLIDPLHPKQIWDGSRANLEVYYTALAHPDAWNGRTDAIQPAVANLFRQGMDSFAVIFPEESLDDGQAIMHHDAMLTAIKVVDTFAAQGNTHPSASAVANLLTSALSPVAAASGWISFDEKGNPVNKAIPIVQISPDGKVSFSELTSENGKPPGAPGTTG